MRFTLGRMFLVIAMLALAFAGFTHRDYFWACLVFSTTLVMFVGAAMSGIKGTGSIRAASIWFLVVGSLYLALTTCACFADIGEYIITNYSLAVVAKWLGLGYGPDYPPSSLVMSYYKNIPEFPPKYLFIIGHCVFSWVFGALAAGFAGLMHNRR